MVSYLNSMQTISSSKGQSSLSKILLFAKELHIYQTQQLAKTASKTSLRGRGNQLPGYDVNFYAETKNLIPMSWNNKLLLIFY